MTRPLSLRVPEVSILNQDDGVVAVAYGTVRRPPLLVLLCLCYLACSAAESVLVDKKDLQRIVKGEPAASGRYPYMVSVTEENSLYCGGTLVAPDIVLTANHCIGQVNTGAVEIGRYNISNVDEAFETCVFQEVAQHPRYFELSGNKEDTYDVALIKIYGTTSDFSPIKLNRDSNVPSTAGEELYVVGWGTDEENFTEVTDVLYQGEVFYVPADECKTIAQEHAEELRLYDNPIDYSVTLCAGDFKELDDTCRGDSGGPILLKGETSEDDVQVGVTSWGPEDCGDPNIPAFYARVSEVKDWIDNNVCRMSLNPPDDFGCAPSSVSNEPDFSGELVEVTIEIQLYTFPQETGWILQSANENDMLVTYGYQPIGSLVNETVGFGGSLVTTVLNIPNNRAYVFTVLDSFGDGAEVGITIYQGNETEPLLDLPIESFEYSFSSDFALGDSPSRSPTASPGSSATFMRKMFAHVVMLTMTIVQIGSFVQ